MRKLHPIAIAFIFAFAAVLAAGCSSSPQTASARLLRPSGLAYATRTTSTADVPVARADLFIADSEAQGIRVLQLLRTIDINNTITDQQAFIAAPVVFFPLEIPAEGFPTRIAISKNKAQDRLYALSPLTRTLHVLDVREIPYFSEPAQTGNYPLSSISLEGLGGPEGGTPVALAVVSSTDDTDFVVVAVDGSTDATSTLLALSLKRTGDDVSVVNKDAETIGDGPRDLVVHGSSVLASSALSTLVAAVTASTSTSGKMLAAAQLVDAGSPTSSLIDVPGQGVLALAFDRPSAIMLEDLGGGLFARSTKRFDSPFTTDAERTDPSTLGRIDVSSSPLTNGAHGFLEKLSVLASVVVTPGTTAQPVPVPLIDGPSEVVLIGHTDGRASILVGSPLKLALQAETTVAQLTRTSTALIIGGGNCANQAMLCGGESIAPACKPETLGFSDFETRTLRAEYKGALYVSRTGKLTAQAPGVFELTDTSTTPFTSRQIRAGDGVLLQAELPSDCANAGSSKVLVTATATTATVTADRVVLSVDVSAAGNAPLDCPAGAALVLGKYEIYAGGNEVVLARWRSAVLDSVFGRFPVTASPQGGEQVQLSGAFNLTLSTLKGFQCRDQLAEGAECYADRDCGGETCTTPVGECVGRCVPCDPTVTASCLPKEVIRRCDTLEVSTAGAIPATTGLSIPPSSNVSAPSTDQTIFTPIRQSFFSTVPSAREVAEAYLDSDGLFNVRELR